jgi:hypothetical protein
MFLSTRLLLMLNLTWVDFMSKRIYFPVTGMWEINSRAHTKCREGWYFCMETWCCGSGLFWRIFIFSDLGLEWTLVISIKCMPKIFRGSNNITYYRILSMEYWMSWFFYLLKQRSMLISLLHSYGLTPENQSGPCGRLFCPPCHCR